MSERSESVEAACPLCGSGARRDVYARRAYRAGDLSDFGIVECLDCAAVYLSPRPPADAVWRYYGSRYYNVANAAAGASRVTSHAYRYKRYLEAARDGGPGTLLDVGCGDGQFLALMAANGWECHGVEPNPALREAVTSIGGVRSVVESLSEVPRTGFDCITLFEVIEHLPEPVEDVRACADLLAPGGIVIVKTPNWRSFERRLLGPNWVSLEVPRHVTFFAQESLRRCLSQANLRVLRVAQPPDDRALTRSLWLMLTGKGRLVSAGDVEFAPRSWRRTADTWLCAALSPLWWMLGCLRVGHSLLVYAASECPNER